MKNYCTLAAFVAVLALSAVAMGETIHFREGAGDGYTDVVFDDGHINAYDTASGDAHGDGGYNGINTSTRTSTYGGWHMDHRNLSYFAVKDMFTHLASEGTTILSATLHLTANYATDAGTMAINPITTDWMVGDAGTNEGNVSGFYCDNANTTTWAGGGNFRAENDLDLVNQSTSDWTGANGYKIAMSFDVTTAIQGIYANGNNYGFALRILFEESEETQTASFTYMGSEYGTINMRPSLEIEYEAAGPLYGDLDGDDFVGGNDLNIVLGSWGQNVEAGNWLLGDPSGDGMVGGDDLNEVLGNWGAGTPPSMDVPEPVTLSLLLAGSLGLIARRKRS